MLRSSVIDGVTMPFQKETWLAVRERVIEFLFRSDIEYSEFQSCTMALLWGCWLAFNPIDRGIQIDGGLFADAGPQTLVALRTLLPTWVWSFWFISLGAGHLIALAKRLWTARRFFSFMATLTWLYVAIFLGLTNIRMIAVPTTLFFALGAAWGFWRLRSFQTHHTLTSPGQRSPSLS